MCTCGLTLRHNCYTTSFLSVPVPARREVQRLQKSATKMPELASMLLPLLS